MGFTTSFPLYTLITNINISLPFTIQHIVLIDVMLFNHIDLNDYNTK